MISSGAWGGILERDTLLIVPPKFLLKHDPNSIALQAGNLSIRLSHEQDKRLYERHRKEQNMPHRLCGVQVP